MAQELTDNFVIIAGAPKCGSNSLFQYLGDHPEVCGAVDKEVGFFTHPIIARNHAYKTLWTGKFYTEKLSAYLNAFSCQKFKRYYLEATTGYLYSPDTAEVIHQHLPKSKLLFIFRNPVERFVSIYKFYQQLHWIPRSMSLKQFLDMQDDDLSMTTTRTLATGKYSNYLRVYWDEFDHNNILLLNFTQLKHAPLAMMQRTCEFLEIDPIFYENYIFQLHYPTQTYRNNTLDRLQNMLIMPIRGQLQRFPRLFQIVSAISRRIWLPFYQRLNCKPADKRDIPIVDLEFLRDYYKDEARLLYELTGVEGLISDSDDLG